MNTDQKNTNFSILISGDFCPVNRIESICVDGDFNALFNDLLPHLKAKDFSITNLECPLTDNPTPIKKTGPHLKAVKATAQTLKEGGFDAVTLANNHIMDQGRSGLASTLECCKELSIKTVGAGMNSDEAGRIQYIQKENRNIALINACENEFSIATPGRAGANLLDDINILTAIKKAKAKAEIVLTIVHAGTEGFHLPSPSLVKRLRTYADFGASAVIVHHSHIASGYELYNGVPILYGLGNFIFDLNKKILPGWNKGMLCRLDFNDTSFQKLELIPFDQNMDTPGCFLMKEDEKAAFLADIEKYSEVIRNEETLAEEWTKFSTNISYRRFLPSLLNFNKLQKNAFKKNLMKSSLVREQQLMKLLDLFRCDSHRETIIEFLEEALNIKKNE